MLQHFEWKIKRYWLLSIPYRFITFWNREISTLCSRFQNEWSYNHFANPIIMKRNSGKRASGLERKIRKILVSQWKWKENGLGIHFLISLSQDSNMYEKHWNSKLPIIHKEVMKQVENSNFWERRTRAEFRLLISDKKLDWYGEEDQFKWFWRADNSDMKQNMFFRSVQCWWILIERVRRAYHW